ncbi:MAG: hypothetical protein P8Y70_19490, partial [Candidatus Lokiarchaeota archaeon]
FFVIPKVKAADPYYPGFAGNPPDIQNEDNVNGWDYAVNHFAYNYFYWGSAGLHTVTPLNYEINIPGPTLLYLKADLNLYVINNNLHIEKITSFRPVFYLDSASWYGHKLDLKSSASTSFKAEFNLGISSLEGDCSIYGGYSRTTSTTFGFSWSVRADNGKWRVIYAYMTFLHVYGNVTFFNGEVRNYDAVINEGVSLINHPVAKSEDGDLKELPMYTSTSYVDKDGDGPDPFPDPPNFCIDYSWAKSETGYFGVKLAYSGEYFGLSGGAKFTFSSSSETTITHCFNSSWSNIPSKYDYYNVAINNFFNVNLKPHNPPGGGVDSGCPYLSVFDGSGYVNEGLLNIHRLDGIDVVTNHTLITNPEPVNGQYLLKLTEHPKTISYIDHVQLQGRLGNNGTLVPLELVTAQHCVLGNVITFLKYSDDNGVIEKGADHNNGVSQYINLGFKAPEHLHFKELIFTIEGNNMLVK